jgi:AcrR family transcriptional regulator
MAARARRDTSGDLDGDGDSPGSRTLPLPPDRPGPSRRGAWRRDKILTATIRLVARNGGRGTSLAEIAGEAGVTQQGLLHYFASKEALHHAALDVVGMFTLLLVENLGEHAPLRDRLAERYELVRKEYADAIRAAQAAGSARLDIDPDLKAIEVIAFLNGLETSWLLNPAIPVERVAEAWARDQRATMTEGIAEGRRRS